MRVLGVMVDGAGSTDAMVRFRLQQAQSMLHRLRASLRSRDIHRRKRGRRPVGASALYGAGAWSISSALAHDIHIADMGWLRSVVQVTRRPGEEWIPFYRRRRAAVPPRGSRTLADPFSEGLRRFSWLAWAPRPAPHFTGGCRALPPPNGATADGGAPPKKWPWRVLSAPGGGTHDKGALQLGRPGLGRVAQHPRRLCTVVRRLLRRTPRAKRRRRSRRVLAHGVCRNRARGRRCTRRGLRSRAQESGRTMRGWSRIRQRT